MTIQEAKTPQSQIPALYDQKAKVYDIWGQLTETKARKRAIELAAIQDGERILEVAVGTGLAFAEIVKNNPSGENIGLDISPGMLAKARQRLSRIPGSHWLEIGSALDLPYEAERFDLLLNNYMFDLLSFADMDTALKEFHRVLKPGGRLILVNMTLGEKLGSDLYERIYSLSAHTMGSCRGVQMAGKLANFGFEVHSREYFQQLLFPSEVIHATRL